ncbi:unnamed protein product, partial [Mesorhabditis belari]|uniref:Uncharacterized protein n=1 Tax=Mesorhabditis belari TaxID=2138241 RepID=A0AAF3FET1_9BILA
MTLEYQSEGVWLGTQVVGFCAQFIDMMKFAAFLTKLSNIAGYQQLIVSNGNASPKMEQDPDVFEQEEFEDDSESDESDENISMLPRFSVLQDYTAVTVTQRYIELVVDEQTHRFAHRPGDQRREFGRRGLGRTLPKGKCFNCLVPGVVLQGLPPGNQQYGFASGSRFEVNEVDLFIEKPIFYRRYRMQIVLKFSQTIRSFFVLIMPVNCLQYISREHLEQYVDKSVSPCDNFFAHVCPTNIREEDTPLGRINGNSKRLMDLLNTLIPISELEDETNIDFVRNLRQHLALMIYLNVESFVEKSTGRTRENS